MVQSDIQGTYRHQKVCTILDLYNCTVLLGEWIGVEWDDQSRGKHDGVHDGVKYFTCRSVSLSHHYIIITSYCSVPGSGSFVRRRKIDFGESFVEVFKKGLSIKFQFLIFIILIYRDMIEKQLKMWL